MPPFEVPPPPPRPDAPALWAMAAIPIVGSLGTLALVMSGGRRQVLVGLALAAATLGAMLLQATAQASSRRRQLTALREAYRRELHRARAHLLAAAASPDGLIVTVGRGPRTLEFAPREDDPRSDPVCVAARDRFVAAYEQIDDAPYCLDLAATDCLRADRHHARAILLAAAETHGADRVRIEVRTHDPEAWSWVALLPHHGGPGPHRLIVADDVAVAGAAHTTILEIGEPAADYHPDSCGPAEAAARARSLAARTHRAHDAAPPWTVSLGAGEDGPVLLDVREAADGGVGPHGLLVGATGSGKSELLRHVLGELIDQHSADELRLALIDFKGGAAFADFADLPHTVAYVTNLADPALALRLHEALEGELIRRQRELAEAAAASVRQHPMPRLLIVVDEFAEVLAASPETAQLFARIGRLGRSLGIHLLLSTQRLDDGRWHGLEAHVSYRIALRTFTAAESRLAIGTPAAAELPRRPGSGILASADGLRSFAAPDPGRRLPTTDRVELISLTARPHGPTVLEQRVRNARGAPAPRLWLPPLGTHLALTDLPPGEPLQAVVGWVDLPREQRIDPLVLDLSGAGGHVAIVGGPRSGKSTALRTVAAALRRSTPCVRLLGVDLTGGLAGALPPERLSSARTPERVDRLLRHLRRLSDEHASPPIVVLIDGWGAMRDQYSWLDAWHRIAEKGLAADIHLVVATHRWSDLRPAVRDLFGSRIELRLGDPIDSEIDRRLAAGVRASPGSGLIAPGMVIQVAVDSPS